MSTSLHDALTELAEDISPDDVPADLAASAWAAGHQTRRSSGVRVVSWLAAAAAVLLVAWFVASGTDRPDASPADGSSRTGLPQRLTWQADPPDLPATGAPLAGLIEVGSAGAQPDELASRDTVNGGTSWQAFTADGRLWSLDGPAAPQPKGVTEGQEVSLTAPPAVSPDGRRVAVARTINRVVHEDSMSKETRVLRQLIDVHDVVTGQHWQQDEVCGGDCTVSTLRWDETGRDLAALAHETQGPALLLWRLTDPFLGTVPLDDTAPRVQLLGWTNSTRVLLTEVSESGSPVVRGRLRPLEVETSEASVRRLATQEVRVPEGGMQPVGTALLGDEIALLDPLAGDRLVWQTYAVPRPAGVETGVAARDLTGTLRDDQTQEPRAWRTQGGALLVSLRGGVIRSEIGRGEELLTVVDPRLHAQDILIAEEAEREQGATSLLGTRTSWWSWRPGLAVALGLAPFVLLAAGLLARRVVRRARRAR